MKKKEATPGQALAPSKVESFLQKAAQTPLTTTKTQGRLVFALDATASREPTWDRACQIQGEMFQATRDLGGLAIQLAFYRGFNEFSASPWTRDATTLLNEMLAVRCLGGHTQIARLLNHTLQQSRQAKINALVFIGDCVEEKPDQLYQLAGELGLLGIPIFIFHEGDEATAQHCFKHMCELSRGAYSPFNFSSAAQLKELLAAVAVYAVGGYRALSKHSQSAGQLTKNIVKQLENK